MSAVAETTRPSPDSIKQAYKNIFHSYSTLSRLHEAAISDRLFTSDPVGVPGRSLAWKLFLLQKEPLEPIENQVPSPPFSAVRKARKDYVDLVAEKFRAPDGTYEDGFVLPGSAAALSRSASPNINLNTHNPLSLSDENPWTEYFANVELRKTVAQDVERTFPEIGYFRDPHVQRELTDILFVYALSHPTTGYRQGMHEILASIYFAVDYDSLAETSGSSVNDSSILDFCSRTWVAADAWALFEAVMLNLSRWYEWRDTSPTTDMKPTELPIVQVCKQLQHELLRMVDPLLWKSLHDTGIEPQIYGMRWLRLLFTREFSMSDAMFLWDGLFACDPTFELAVWLCVAMLIRIRNELIPSDYTGQLSCLLRYPSPPTLPDTAASVNPYALLLKQAIALQTSPTAATGSSVTIENRNLLNIPLDVPDPPPIMSHRREGKRTTFATEGRASARPQLGHARQLSSQAAGLSELFARNLIERGESLGFNNIMSAVSELRVSSFGAFGPFLPNLQRNLPEIASPFVRSPAADDSYAAFPLRDDRGVDGRGPAWESHSRFELEKEIANFRAMNKQLGEAAGWILDAIRNNDATDIAAQTRREKALDSLSYLRDALQSGSASPLEESRLFDEEALQSRRTQASTPSSSSPPLSQEYLHPRYLAQARPPLSYPQTPSITSSPSTPPIDHHQLTSRGQNRSKFAATGRSPPSAVTVPRIQSTGKPGPTIPSYSPPIRRKSEEVPRVKKETMLDPLGVLH